MTPAQAEQISEIGDALEFFNHNRHLGHKLFKVEDRFVLATREPVRERVGDVRFLTIYMNRREDDRT